MALAAKMLAARFNTAEQALITSRIFMFCSDGDLQEGLTAEAASFAGHLGLGNLIAVYDNNDITIGGRASLSMSENVGERFQAYGWHVQHCDGHDHEAIAVCYENALKATRKPSLIVAKTTIGIGTPTKADTPAAHGAPLGEQEIQQAKANVGWPENEKFLVPDEVRKVFQQRAEEGRSECNAWQHQYRRWRKKNHGQAQQWDWHWNRSVPKSLLKELSKTLGNKEDATRNLSGMVIQTIAEQVPAFAGGSADLEPSTKTIIKNAESICPSSMDDANLPDPSFAGRNIHFGIREHAMGTITNGMALFGGWLPYCATFEVFADYMRPSLRLAAISHLPTTFVFTHDSIAVGEDGPTHQPVEQHWALRLIPNLEVWRPADAQEVAAAWYACLESANATIPKALLLTRQTIQHLKRPSNFQIGDILRGGYVVADCDEEPEVILISTGSEGGAVQEARLLLLDAHLQVRHVSMPCLERFEQQDLEYQIEVLPLSVFIVVVEAGVTRPWYQYADHVIGINEYGASAPGGELMERYGFTGKEIADEVLDILEDDEELADALMGDPPVGRA
jgi:transketolase